MTFDEAGDILEALILSYPRHGLTDAAMESWIEAIHDSRAEPDQALLVARRWGRTHEWFPSLAEFLVVVTPRQEVQPVDDPDEWRASPAIARRMAREWRIALDAAAKKAAEVSGGRGVEGHWHGGPKPCPVCGGMKR